MVSRMRLRKCIWECVEICDCTVVNETSLTERLQDHLVSLLFQVSYRTCFKSLTNREFLQNLSFYTSNILCPVVLLCVLLSTRDRAAKLIFSQPTGFAVWSSVAKSYHLSWRCCFYEFLKTENVIIKSSYAFPKTLALWSVSKLLSAYGFKTLF